MKKGFAGFALTILVTSLAIATAHAQSTSSTPTSTSANSVEPIDPGVQSGNRNTGAGVASLSSSDGSLQFFQNGQTRFQDVEDVSGGTNNGLGPRFNSVSCSSCHAQPAVGGTGPATNPQFTFTQSGVAPDNSTPFFITANGPTREARFPFFLASNGDANTNAPNGGVEDLFTVTGRSDAGSCSLQQPPFGEAARANDIIFRIPTPTFGAGLVENLDDSTLLKNQATNLDNNLGVEGTFNHNGNDGTIARFGWKAQNKSLELFAGEAYNVEMGISNEIFTQDRPLPEEDQLGTGLPAECLNLSGNGYPEDTTNFSAATGADQFATNASIPSDVVQFAMFMRLLAAPQPGPVVLNGKTVSQQTIVSGQSLFTAIGCATCHNSEIGPTQASAFTSSLSKQTVAALSDFEIHHMGTNLADNVSQGGAGGDQFRTAPLWGLGQRIFLLHDGRTTNLIRAIEAHASSGSEANTVIDNFNNIPDYQQQEILDFLRSL
jgi:CxxC motif-containing protein (DUF1111 family)